MKIQHIDKNTNTNFGAKMRLYNVEKWNTDIANAIRNNGKLKQFAAESDKDIIIYQSTKTAQNRRNLHNVGDTLYRVSIQKDTDSLFKKMLQFFGYQKVYLSRRYHTLETTMYNIIPNINMADLKSKL